MWGGTPDRNQVSNMKNVPSEWDVKTKKNIKWVADLGSQSYGNPVVAGGMVFVGTNNELLRDPKQGGDRGVLMAFRESDGEFLWQHTHAKLEAGRANDWPFQGVASSPLVEGERLYYVSNRGVVFCLDIQGFRDNENDGPFTDEKLNGQTDADVIWSFDMLEEVGSYPHNLSNSSPVDHGDLDLPEHVERPGREPRPHPVAARAVDHRAQQDDREAGVGGQLGREPHSARPVVHARGRHDRRRGSGRLRAGRRLGPRLRGRERQEALGVRHQPEGLGVAAHAQRADRDAGHLPGPRLHRQRAGSRSTAKASATSTRSTRTKRGDITKTGRVWHFDKIRRSISTAAIADGLLYVSDFSGYLHCLDAKTGQEYWSHDLLAAVWASPFLIDGKVYIGDEDGDIVVMAHSKEKVVIGEMNMGSAVYGTIVPANGTLFSTTGASCSPFRDQVAPCVRRQHCSSCSVLAPTLGAQRPAPASAAGRRLAAVPRHAEPDRRLGQHATRHVESAVDLRRRRT